MFTFSIFPVIHTKRLILRELMVEDVNAVFEIRSNYEVTKYNIGEAYTTHTQALRLINSIADEYSDKTTLRWGITLMPDDKVIGMVGYNYWNRVDNRASIGFDLAQAHWRKGIMREAVQSILNFGFVNMNLHRIEADASIYNEASIRLLESIGFQREGIQRDQYYEDGTYHDLVLMALLEPTWQIIN